MKTVCKKLLSMMLVAVLLVSAVPFQVFATEGTDPVETAAVETTVATEAVVVAQTEAATEAPTEAATEAPTEAATEAATEAPTEAATEAPTEAATEAPTEAATDAATEPVTQPVETEKAPVSANSESNVVYANAHLFLDGGYLPVANDHTVVIGQPYGYCKSLPTPTKEHYDFAGWYTYNGGKKVTDSTICQSDEMLIAKWTLKNYVVWFERYDGNDWVGVKSVKVPALGTLTTQNGFPTDEEINNIYKLSSHKIVGWEIGETDKAFEAGYTQVTKEIVLRPRYQRAVTLMANNPGDYTSNSTRTITVEIGEPYPALPNAGARDGYTFSRWYAVLADGSICEIADKANLSNVDAHPKYRPALGDTIYADWVKSIVTYLYIHTNGNTQTAAKIVPYYEAPFEGAFNTKLINMYAIFPSYGDFDDDNDAAYGWYSASQWKNYCANTAANAATTFYNVGTNMDYAELHIMLINNGASGTTNGYNTNTSTADKTNPTTGDMIFAAVTVMAVSATALALIFFMKKRKASK